MKEYNKTIITGLLKDKKRNMGLKRPMVDFETICYGEEGRLSYIDIGVLLSENHHARALSGMNVGEIYQISGTLCSDENDEGDIELFINPVAIHRLVDKKALPSLLKARAELLEWGDSGNSTVFTGKVVKYAYGYGHILVKRNPLIRGDIRSENTIPVKTEEFLKNGDAVICVGKIEDGYVKVDSIKKDETR